MKYERAGLAFISCLLVGTLVGVLNGDLQGGGTIGLGTGILSIILLRKR